MLRRSSSFLNIRKYGQIEQTNKDLVNIFPPYFVPALCCSFYCQLLQFEKVEEVFDPELVSIHERSVVHDAVKGIVKKQIQVHEKDKQSAKPTHGVANHKTGFPNVSIRNRDMRDGAIPSIALSYEHALMKPCEKEGFVAIPSNKFDNHEEIFEVLYKFLKTYI
jgi:hypothetical protein